MKTIFLVITIIFILFINIAKAQLSGCTDMKATNYNPQATINDGNCIYDHNCPNHFIKQKSSNSIIFVVANTANTKELFYGYKDR